METPKNTSCIICGSEEIRSLKGYEVSHLLKCSNCSHVFDQRIPSNDELSRLYVYGIDHYYSPLTTKRYKELLDSLEVYRKTNNLLDLGCGTGLFLEEARKRGWNVYGTERNYRVIQICEGRGIQIKSDDWLNDTRNYSTFDVITAWELIEHIGQPNQITSQMNRVLRSGGVMYSTTPNFNAINRYLLRNKWNVVIAYPDHLSYFTIKTMDRLMSSNGFKKVYAKTTGYSFTTLRIGLKLSGQKQVSRSSDDEMIRTAIDKSKVLDLFKRVVNKMLTLLRLGESLKSLYQKS